MPGFLDAVTGEALPPLDPIPPGLTPKGAGGFLDFLVRDTGWSPLLEQSYYQTMENFLSAFGPSALEPAILPWQDPSSVETYPQDLERAHGQEESPWIRTTFDFLGSVGLEPDFNVLSQVGSIKQQNAAGLAYGPNTDPYSDAYEPIGRIQLDRQYGLNPVVVAHETAHLGWSYLDERNQGQVIDYVRGTLMPSLSAPLPNGQQFYYGDALGDLLENDPAHVPTYMLELYLAHVMAPDKPTHLLPRYGGTVDSLPVNWEQLRLIVQRIMQPFSQRVESDVDRQG